MCWCDGDTAGVQECQADMTFAACVCDGGTGGDGSGGDDGPASSDAGASDDADPTNPGTSDSSAETAGADDDTGDPVPAGCTDELFSLWLACRQLAGLNNPDTCDPCADGSTCENAQCYLDCIAQGNPGLEADVDACDADYPPCAGILDPGPEAVCSAACSTSYLECLAAVAPECDNMEVLNCTSMQNACNRAC